MDAKDYRILAELDKECRQSNSQVGRKVGLSKEVVKYRIDKMIGAGIIIRFHTVINYFKLGVIKFKLYLRLTHVNKSKLEEIAEYFNKNKKTEWVALTTGRWDLIIGFLVKNANEFDEEVQAALTEFSQYIQEKAVTTTLYLAHHEREFLQRENKRKSGGKIVYHTSQDEQESIGETSKEILRILANNGRISIVEIAEKLKTTPRIVQYRIKELESKKIILAYKAHINPKRLGRIFCKLIIYLTNITRKNLADFINFSSHINGAVWPQKVMGNWDFELDLELNNYDELQEVILLLKENFPEIIRNYEFCILTKELKLDLFVNAHKSIK